MKRRDFLRISLLGGVAATVLPIDLSAKGSGKSGFTLWQIPSQVDTIGNSYVFKTDKGRLVVMDGGMNEEAPFLRGFLSALGCEVEAWFISHPHNDHMGALTEILKKPGDLKIKKIYHSRFSESLIDREEPYNIYAREFYAELDKLDLLGGPTIENGTMRYRLSDMLRYLAAGADVVYTDVWASMGQESEAAERAKIFEGFQVNESVMAAAAPGAMVMHCLPAHRGEEITAEVFEAHANEIFDEAENRLHAQKAVMVRLMAPEA